MVLAELGRKITGALHKLNKTTVIDEEAVKDCLKEICNALIASDIDIKYVFRLRQNILKKFHNEEQLGGNLRVLIKTEVVKELTGLLDAGREPYQPKRGKTNIIMFVGLQGSGKTTTCTKVAYYYKKKGWKVGLVCADTFRAGAFDQLKQNAAKVRVPFYGSYVETDPVAIAEEGVNEFKQEGMEVIIVDTSGRHKQEADLFDEMKQVEKTINPDNIIFVMDSSIGQQCYAQAEAFKKAVNVGSVIITKMDGHSKGGGALSAVAATRSPIIFMGDGQHFQNLQPFDASSFIKRLLGEGDIKQLIEKVKDAVSPKDQAKLLQKVKKGQFTVRDLRSQFESILKLGSLNNFMSLLPGAGTSIINKDNEKESINRIKRFIYIMDSMTPDELDRDAPIVEESRIKRIAKGSGTSVMEVKILLEEHKKLKKLIGSVGKANLGPDKVNMQRNPNQVMGKIQQMMTPQMMAQLGGAGNIMNMMKEMSNNPQMEEMMKSMGGMGGLGAAMGGLGGMGGMGGNKKKGRR